MSTNDAVTMTKQKFSFDWPSVRRIPFLAGAIVIVKTDLSSIEDKRHNKVDKNMTIKRMRDSRHHNVGHSIKRRKLTTARELSKQKWF